MGITRNLGLGIPDRAQIGTSLNPFRVLTPVFNKVYYWYDNTSNAGTRQIKIVHTWEDGLHGTQYQIRKNTDALHELYSTQRVDLVNKKQNTITNPGWWYALTDTINSNCDRVSFNGTKITAKITKGTSYGILRAILFDGIFRGGTQNSAYYAGLVNADKQDGYYYFVNQAGNWTTLDASLTGLQLRDIIQWKGGAWHKYTEAQYIYVDIDCYAAVYASPVKVTLFDNLPLGNYSVGLIASGLKNASSSNTLITIVTSAPQILEWVYSVYGGTPNAAENPLDIFPFGEPHYAMSTGLARYGSGLEIEWIPAHGGENTLFYDSGKDMRYWANGVEITGILNGDLPFQEITSFYMLCDMYAANNHETSEKLLNVYFEMTVDITGIKFDILYSALQKTALGACYSYMLPFNLLAHNKFVTDLKEIKTLPTNTTQVNITDASNRKKVFAYNDTPAHAFENTIALFDIINPSETNRNSVEQSFLYKYGVNLGKFYLLAKNQGYFDTGETWKVSFKMSVGHVPGLIAKVASYLGM